MRPLEEVIEEIEDLDRYRRRAAELRDGGQKALLSLFPVKNAKFDLSNLGSERVLAEATVLKSLLVQRRGRVKRMGKDAARITDLTVFITGELEKTTPKDIFDPQHPDKLPILPVLRAARAMSTLVTAPDSALSRTVFDFYYIILRELFTADAPDWIIGGARAGEASAPSAFVTGECTRAIMGLHKALANTATYIEKIAGMLEWREQSKEVVPKAWLEVDQKRAALEFLTTAELQKANISLKLTPLANVEKLDEFLNSSIEDIRIKVGDAVQSFIEARGDAWDFRRAEEAKPKEPGLPEKELNEIEKRLIRSATADKMAYGALNLAVVKGEEAKKVFTDPKYKAPAKLKALATVFSEAAKETAKILYPAKEFLSRVLDRQLAAAAAGAAWDSGEMVFAAVAFGYVTNRWDDDRLARAAKLLAGALSPRGRFPIGQAIFTDENGFAMHVLNAEQLRAFAQLLQHVNGDLSPDLARRMLIFLEDTQVAESGIWHNDDVRIPKKPQPWVTATAVYALDRINRMLDTKINQRVFEFFTVRWPKELDIPELPDLFYPDYGLAHHKVKSPKSTVPRESVAFVLERMRAHVVGVADDQRWGERTWSLILYGPPGTGKTTLAQALAKSCNVPFVEVTPSDIVIAGVDKVEHRARAVFKALSLLTRAVILFDEFEPVLQKRRDDDPNPTVFSFVTPGMLPKLKTLHDAAERRGVAYVLNTNLLRKLDDAAIRGGRFDRRIGVYPPDVLSRIGRLFSVIDKFEVETKKTGNAARKWEVIQKTACGPMNTLGKRGWYTMPKQIGTGQRNAFEYIFNEVEPYDYSPPAEADLKRHAGGREAAREEFYDWSFAVAWDDAIKNLKLQDPVEDAVEKIMRLAPEPSKVAAIIQRIPVPRQRSRKAAKPTTRK
ncbi:MAG: hypothetical protein QOE68_1300 [Thermoanaerobaculia bacterium]|jgi:hypothetical protein|nr:hypothetical protein [Thermoanaerobaculia bacterium]